MLNCSYLVLRVCCIAIANILGLYVIYIMSYAFEYCFNELKLKHLYSRLDSLSSEISESLSLSANLLKCIGVMHTSYALYIGLHDME